MNMNSLLVIGLTIFCTSVPIANLQEEPPFMLLFTREKRSNAIQLYCRESATSTEILGASYFMNETRINDHPQFSSSSDGRLTFRITRDLEAIYSCGNESNRPLSNNRSLIAYPDGELVPKQPPRYVVSGERVQIDCGVLPGKLLQQYTIDWYKSTQIIVVRNIPMGSPGDHYAVDPSTLSLVINNVTEADTNAHYRCELTVRDPETQQTNNYDDVLGRNFITLIVLDSFRLQVDVTQEGDVFFEVTLTEPLIEPVRLQINYTDAGNPKNPTSIINTTNAYLGNISFLHREYRSQVPFDDFRVGVRLLPYSKASIIGPLVLDPVAYAKNRSTICNDTEQNLSIIVGGAVGGGIAFLTILFISSLVSLCVCCKLICKNKQRQREHKKDMKTLELKEKVQNDPNAVVTEFLMQIYDRKTNTDAVRISIINALGRLRPGLTPRSAIDLDITANGAPAVPQAEPVNTLPEPEHSELVLTRRTRDPESDAADIEMGQINGGCALAGPLPPPTYEQSLNHPMVIIKEHESQEVLEALEAFIGGFSSAVEEHSRNEMI